MTFTRESKPSKSYRTPMEFSDQTKLDALRRAEFRCEMCNRSKDDLKKDGEPQYFELHHILAIAVAIKAFPWIGQEIIRSIENCQCLCIRCHKEVHSQKQDHEKIADELLERYQQKRLAVEEAKKLLGSGGRRRI